jgi:hypothetical protein
MVWSAISSTLCHASHLYLSYDRNQPSSLLLQAPLGEHSVSDRFRPLREKNLVFDDFHNFQLFLASRLLSGLLAILMFSPSNDSHRIRKLLHFTSQALIPADVEVNLFCPGVRFTVGGVAGENEAACVRFIVSFDSHMTSLTE